MASYTIVFKKPKNSGDPVCNHHGDHVTDLNDYKYLMKLFQSDLVTGLKYISLRDFDSNYDKEEIYVGSKTGKRKVSFSDNIRFTPHCLRGEVSEERLDQDTTVYFIDANTSLQSAINNASDGDVIALLQKQVVNSPLTCEDKVVVVDMCGSDIIRTFEGELLASENITVKNTVEGSGEITESISTPEPEPEEPEEPEIPEGAIVLEEGQTIASVLETAEAGGVVVIPADTTIEENVTFDKAFTLMGAADGSSKLTGIISVTADEGTVVIQNMTIGDIQSSTGTGSGNRNSSGYAIAQTGNADLEIKDSTLEGMKYFYSVIFSKKESTGNLTLDNVTVGSNDCYHVVEAWAPATEINIKNCTFDAKSCTHNVCSFYDFTEDAVVNLENNTFGYSGNAYRFSNSSNAAVTINIKDNTMLTTDQTLHTDAIATNRANSDFWAGLVILQQWKETMDFSKMVFNISGTKLGDELITENNLNSAKQLVYVIIDNSDWTLTEPTVNVS